MAARTTALTQAFIPGASPPEVMTAILRGGEEGGVDVDDDVVVVVGVVAAGWRTKDFDWDQRCIQPAVVVKSRDCCYFAFN